MKSGPLLAPRLSRRAPNEFGLGPGHDPLVLPDFRSKTIKRRTGRQHPRSYFQRGIARNRINKADMKVSRNSLNSAVKKAMGHGRIQQGGNNASVKHVGVSLESLTGLETGLHAAVMIGLERQLQGPWVPLAAENTPAVTILGADVHKVFQSLSPHDGLPQRSSRPQQVLPVCSREHEPAPCSACLRSDPLIKKPAPPLIKRRTAPRHSGHSVSGRSVIGCRRSNRSPHLWHSYS